MNAGMYGMADGQGMAGRKVVSVIGQGDAALPYNILNQSGYVTTSTPTIANNTPTKVLSVTGRGAIRLLSIAHATSQTSGNAIYKLVVDGVSVVEITRTVAGSNTTGPLLVGSVVYSYAGVLGAVKDYFPFSNSVELWVNAVAVGAGTSYFVTTCIDLHQ